MANEFIIKHGFHSKSDSQITGSLNISNTTTALVISGSTISGSLIGDGSSLSGVSTETITASNTGSGDGLFLEKVSSDLRFKTLLSGSSELTITTSSYEVTVNRQSVVFDETKLYFSNDTTDTTITIGTNSGSNFKAFHPVNTLEAVANGSSNVRVQLKGGAVIVANSLVTSSIYINDTLVTTSSLAAVTSSLNDLFANTYGQTAPTITSATSISISAGGSVDYTLTGTNIVAYRWSNLPSGVVPKTGNIKTLIGGSGLSAATYYFTASVVNYYGEATTTMSLIVS
tara:strand:- start:2118 stop:2975 length:858 start_codon:yes stop_codon:yes gene_type:complete